MAAPEAELHVVTRPQLDPRLGRQVVHDSRSRDYEHRPRTVTRPGGAWRHRVYNPRPVPEQTVGCCTGVDQCVKANARGNRVPGVVLGMDDAIAIYSRATQLDQWTDQQYPPYDTGSSSLAACKASMERGDIERYEWIFAGVDAVIAALILKPVGVGTWWYDQMFHPEGTKQQVRPGGSVAGGHQWSLVGYDPSDKLFTGMCWWGPDFGRNGSFTIHRDDLADLLADDGDAHVTYRRKG